MVVATSRFPLRVIVNVMEVVSVSLSTPEASLMS